MLIVGFETAAEEHRRLLNQRVDMKIVSYQTNSML